jgi:hypothetical protein
VLALTTGCSMAWEACLAGTRELTAVQRLDSRARDFLWIFAGAYFQDFFPGWVRFVQKILRGASASGLVFCMA